jgi:hypothetical protein
MWPVPEAAVFHVKHSAGHPAPDTSRPRIRLDHTQLCAVLNSHPSPPTSSLSRLVTGSQLVPWNRLLKDGTTDWSRLWHQGVRGSPAARRSLSDVDFGSHCERFPYEKV